MIVLFSLIYQYLQLIFFALRNIFAEISSLKYYEILLNFHNFLQFNPATFSSGVSWCIFPFAWQYKSLSLFFILCFKACSIINLLMLFIFIDLKLLSFFVISPITTLPCSFLVCVLLIVSSFFSSQCLFRNQ